VLCIPGTEIFLPGTLSNAPFTKPNFVFDGWVPSSTGIRRLLRRHAVKPSPRSRLDGVAPQSTLRGPGVAARGRIAPLRLVLDAHRPSSTIVCPLFRRAAVKRHRLDASRRGVEPPVRQGLDGAQPSWQGLWHPVTPPRPRAPSEDGIDGTWPSSPLARWTFPARSRRVPRCAAFSGARPSSTAQRGCRTARSRRVPVLVVFYGQQPSSTASSDIMRLAAWSSQSTRKDTIFMVVEPNFVFDDPPSHSTS
jgi:hypothetical protein